MSKYETRETDWTPEETIDYYRSYVTHLKKEVEILEPVVKNMAYGDHSSTICINSAHHAAMALEELRKDYDRWRQKRARGPRSKT